MRVNGGMRGSLAAAMCPRPRRLHRKKRAVGCFSPVGAKQPIFLPVSLRCRKVFPQRERTTVKECRKTGPIAIKHADGNGKNSWYQPGAGQPFGKENFIKNEKKHTVLE